MKDHEYLKQYAASLYGQPKNVERLEMIADRLKKLESAYCKLTNCDYYQDGPNLAGVYCPTELLHEFDELFDA